MRKIITYNMPHARLLAYVLGIFMLSGCLGGGNTDGGKGNDTADNGATRHYVADGGAGATITLEAPTSMTVGETQGFSVHLKDPRGVPLEYVRIACDSEKGISILEPSSGGVAFEQTGANGGMSGVLGGLLPGSYMMECRAPEGFGLVARQSIHIGGEIPGGFVGFPGAAGGNLGGGIVVEETDTVEPDVPDSLGAFRIVGVYVNDGGEKMSSGPVDIKQDQCEDGEDEDGNKKYKAEPYFFNHFFIDVQNDSLKKVTIGTVGFTVQDGGPGMTSTQSKVVVIEPGTSGEVDGLLTEFFPDSNIKKFTGGSYEVKLGTYKIDLVITGEMEDGTSFTKSRSFTLTFDDVNNCSN